MQPPQWLSYLAQGELARCYVAVREALILDPADLSALRAFGRLPGAAEALAWLQRAARLRPDRAETWAEFGMVAGSSEALRRALALAPDHRGALQSLAVAEIDRDPDAAAWALRCLIALSPEDPRPLGSLLVIETKAERFATAARLARRLLCLQPDDRAGWRRLGGVLERSGDFDAATGALLAALRLEADPNLHSRVLYLMEQRPGWPAERRAAERRRYDSLHGHPPPLAAAAAAPGERLTIGYVSPDFRFHAVRMFLEPVLQAHDRGRFRIACYSEVPEPDEATRAFERLADLWRPTVGVADRACAEMIRADGVDVLIDLAGHTEGNRLPVFGYRPAPVQMSWLGLPFSTGLAAMDYVIADPRLVPPGCEGEFSERLLRLPQSFVCFRSGVHGAAPKPPGDSVLFGSCAKVAKLNPAVARVWTGILRAVPGSRLRLKSLGLAQPALRAGVRALFAEAGLEPERLELQGPDARYKYLAGIGELDLMLDTFPACGGTVTLDALSMGVPVVALAGDRSLGRYGASILHSLGLQDELLCATEGDYTALAVALAGDPRRRRDLAARILAALEASILSRPEDFTRQLERGLAEAWRRACAGLAPEDIEVS